MSTKIIIFLDVDGVLNCRTSSWKEDGTNTLDTQLCDNFGILFHKLRENGFSPAVILSSTWRLFKDGGILKLKSWLKERNIGLSGETPNLCWKFATRGEEIHNWLETNDELNTKILILDDDSDFLEAQKPFHVHTSFEDGFNDDKLQEALMLCDINYEL